MNDRYGMLVLAVLTLTVCTIVVGAQESTEYQKSIVIETNPDGNAQWTVTDHLDLPTNASRQTFDQLISNQSQRQAMQASVMEPYREILAELSADRNRTMQITNSTLQLQRYNSTGEVHVSFQWSNFTRAQEREIWLDDVLAGFTIREGAMLRIEAPEGYQANISDVPNATVANNSVQWVDKSFVPSQASIRFLDPVETQKDTNQTDPTNETADPDQSNESEDDASVLDQVEQTLMALYQQYLAPVF